VSLVVVFKNQFHEEEKNHFFSDVKKTKQTKLVFLICHLYYYITYGSSSFKKKEKYEIVPRENKKKLLQKHLIL